MFRNYFKFQLYHLPIITAIWFTVTFLLVYIVAVLQGHVSPLFPYISFAGATPPESCIFGFLLNTGGALLSIGVYVRYRLLKFSSEFSTSKFLNNFSYYLGLLACLGIVLVANFQETNAVVMHALGALCAFGSATIYCCIQAWITWRSDISIFLKSFRVFLSIILISSFLNNSIFGGLAMKQFTGEDMMKWKPDDGGYGFHLAATFSEWIMAVTLNVYIFTFESEFKKISFEGIVFTKNVDEINN